jgi:hypothetical protein
MSRQVGERRSTGATEIRLDRLLGRNVLGTNGQRLGRLEEFRAEPRGKDIVIAAYVIGAAGLFERMGVGLRLLVGSHVGGYVAGWEQLDISDPDRPRLTCGVEELERF